MMGSLTFTVDRSQLEGKQGKLTKDKDGYYEMLAGAYNIPNSCGERYVFTDEVKNMFVNSRMVSKLKLGQLYGECNHPSLDEYRSKARSESDSIALWMNRLGRIVMNNLAFHSNNVRWAELDKRVDGRPVYGVYLKVKPLVEPMSMSLSDPNQNTALSVRSFVNRKYSMGEILVTTKDIITYDWIAHGGIHLATKYNTPSLEGEIKEPTIYTGDQALITPELLSQMEHYEKADTIVGAENSVLFNTMMIRDVAGWREVPDLSSLVSRRW